MGHQKRFCTKCFSLYNGGRDACCGQDTLNIHAEAKFPPKYNGNLTKEWKNFIGSYVFMKSHLSYDDNKKIYDFLKKLGLLEKTGEIFFQKLTLENEKKEIKEHCLLDDMLSGKACQFGKNENVLSFIKLLNHVMDKNVTTSNISDNFLIVSPLICFESTILHNKNSEFSRWIKQIDYSMLNTKIKYLICDVKFNGNNKPFIKYNNKSYFTSSVPYKEENQYPIYFHFKNKHEVNTFERVYSFFVSEYDKSFSMFNDFELKQYSNKDKYEYLKFIVSQKNINQDLNIKHER